VDNCIDFITMMVLLSEKFKCSCLLRATSHVFCDECSAMSVIEGKGDIWAEEGEALNCGPAAFDLEARPETKKM